MYSSGGPGAGQLEIGIALVLQDRFSNQCREATAQMRKLHQDAKMAVNANLGALQDISQQGINIAKQASRFLSGAVVDGAEFIDTMVTVGAITAATNEQMSELGSTALSLGLKTMFDSREIASGMKYLAMAGTQAEDINDIINGAAMVANATGLQLGGKGGSADLLTNVMRMFQIEGKGAADVIGDQLTKATLSANMSMTDLAEAVKYAGADMVNLKQNLPSVAAMIGVLGNAGIQGSMAGTAVANMARYFNKSITSVKYKGTLALKKLGFNKSEFLDAKGDIIDFGTVLEKLSTRMQQLNLTSTEQSAIFLDIFGVRGNRAAAAISRDIDGYRDLLGKIQNESAGFAKDVVDQRMASLAGSMDVARSAWENFKTTFAKSLEPVLAPTFRAIGGVIEVVRKLFAIPILGPIISTGAVASTMILGIGSLIVNMRARWIMMRNDSLVTSRSWFAILKSGWASATLSAQNYMMMQTAILAQQKGGMGGLPMFATMIKHPGQWVGNARLTYSKKGVPYYWRRDPSTGAVTRTNAQGANAAIGGPTAFVGSLMGKPNPAVAGAGAAGSAAASIGVRAGMKTVLGKLVGIGGRFLGLLGGPVGIAITAGSILLPALISKIGQSNKASDENSKALKDLTQVENKSLLQRLEEVKQKEAQRAMTESMENLSRTINYWGQKISGGSLSPSQVVVNNTIDISKGVSKTVKQVIDMDKSQEQINLNTL